MKLATFGLLLALVPAWPQIQLKQAPAAVAAKPAEAIVAGSRQAVSLQTLVDIEKILDDRIKTTGPPGDTCVLLGLNRGVYLSGIGAVFSSEVELAVSSAGGLFGPTLSPEVKAQLHKRKLDHVPMLQESVRGMVKAAAEALRGIPDSDHLVVAVRLIYRPWEDTSGLPGQIVARMDRRGGEIKLEVQ
jgi:hypothetical protein